MTFTLRGVTRDSISPLGIITLPVTVEEEPKSKTLMAPFVVVPFAYNVIFGYSILNKLRPTVSTYHCTIKILTSAGVKEVKRDPRESRQCYLTATTLPKKIKPEALVADPREPSKATPQPEPMEQVVKVPLDQGEIVYPCIPDPDGEDEGGQASSLAVSTRWISAVKLLQSDLATLTQREGGE
ncbi:hypothetical protein B296_00054428 [Ensete ventricosum]|uniref:Uncharacterized protein n=1 Tax=Ensete ventricosum TaxID=4639 RepID=A0A426X073_ENSVE|nr:hypothetical protein B296_00054428 [Ensete ventricosum]